MNLRWRQIIKVKEAVFGNATWMAIGQNVFTDAQQDTLPLELSQNVTIKAKKQANGKLISLVMVTRIAHDVQQVYLL